VITALILATAVALIALLGCAISFLLCRRLLITGERLSGHIERQLQDRIARTRELERMLDEQRAATSPAITHPAMREDATPPAPRRKYSPALEQQLRAIDSDEDRLEYIATIDARLTVEPDLDQDELARELFA
jgi:hypothetical protein